MLSALLLSTLAFAAQGYLIEDLGTLSATPTDGVRAASIDNLGRVHGENDKTSPLGLGVQWRSFLWTEGILEEVIPPAGGASWSGGSNDGGQLVGYYTAPPGGGAAFPLHGYLWQAGIFTDINLGNHDFTRIYDINGRGDTAGTYTSDVVVGLVFRYHAFVRDAAGAWLDLGTLGGSESRSYAINERRQVIGFARTASDAHAGFLWQPASGMIDIGHLGGTYCDPEDLDIHGRIVGASKNALGKERPFLWDNGTMRDLGTLGGSKGRAKGINDHGDVVGNAEDASGIKRAVLWPDGGAAVDLNQFLPPGSGWDLTGAHEINELGEICGTGKLNGVQRAYRLEPILSAPRLSGFLPGIANRSNTLRGFGFLPNATVELYYGFAPGITSAPCGATLDIQQARLFGQATANAHGRIAFAITLPPAASGLQVYLQAVEAAACTVSERRLQQLY